jgi:spectinomycin phosphotransferase
MLEKPDLQDDRIVSSLLDEYSLDVEGLTFLPIGADQHTAVYRAISKDGIPYFVKLRRGIFDAITVSLPRFLRDKGIVHIIAPLATESGKLWANLEDFTLVLYPFIEGQNGYEVDLSDYHWIDLGRALKNLHALIVPPEFRDHIPQETYSPQWREILKTLLASPNKESFPDSVARELAAFLKARRHEMLDLVVRAERLALVLQAHTLDFVLCHSDIHAGNVLIDPSGALYIVDWDNPIFAPKERDLMFIGGGHWGEGHTAHGGETLFYRGYGPTKINLEALAYYRYERIVEDIAVFSQRIFSISEGRENRELSLQYLKSNFLPNGTIEIAYQKDTTRKTS